MRAVTTALGVSLLLTATIAAPLGAGAGSAAQASTAQGTTAASAARTLDDSPSGFIYGTDSWPVGGNGRSAPYHEPVIGGSYGGYIGMAGNWARSEGCKTGNFLAWSWANSKEANVDYYKYHLGIGTGVYWYMGGPGVDPHWNGTAAEARRWGEQQAAWTLAAIKQLRERGRPVASRVVWADIEMPQIAPAPDNGWNSVYSSPCSGYRIQSHIPANVDRAEFNGFANYIVTHSMKKVGVYSCEQVWRSIFGTGTASRIPNTYEWTYWPETSNLNKHPSGWYLRGTSVHARFFGGQGRGSKYALMWQWSGGGGVTNGHGDFDQIDFARMK